MAAAKRSPVVTSSSQGEIGLLDLVQPIETSHALFRRIPPAPLFVDVSLTSRPPPTGSRSEATQRQLHDLFSFVPLAADEVREYWKQKQRPRPGEGYCEFLQGCYFCNKRLHRGHIYMYGYLGAFCSPECREKQIALDGFEQQMSNELSSTAIKLQVAAGKS